MSCTAKLKPRGVCGARHVRLAQQGSMLRACSVWADPPVSFFFGGPHLEKATTPAKGGVVPAGTGPIRPRAGARSPGEDGGPMTSGLL